MRWLSPTGSTLSSTASPSTWPVTTCPPISSPSFSERSRFIPVPTTQVPIEVRDRLSSDTSTANQPPPSAEPLSTRVLHAPAQELEAPNATHLTSQAGAISLRVYPGRSI